MPEFSPMMQHYLETKEKYKDCILFYRLGDFYEMFFDDAVNVSQELELTLTGKDCGQAERAPMCGIPYHAAEGYISKLIENGHKVAICEQLEDPKLAKGIVKRDVIRVVTPGTVTESNLLEEKRNNYIMSIFKKGMSSPMPMWSAAWKRARSCCRTATATRPPWWGRIIRPTWRCCGSRMFRRGWWRPPSATATSWKWAK